MINLDGKVVIVTGGTRGIGLEIVRTFCEHNAKVILFGSKEETVKNTCELLKKEGKNVLGYYPNLTDEEEVKKVIEEIINKYHHIDILINNAGVMQREEIDEITTQEFMRVMNINVTAMFNVTKQVVFYMKKRKQGVILNTSSMVSIYGQAKGVAYPASKSAVNGLTKSLALELASYNIRVNAVAPGIIQSDMVKNLPPKLIEPLIANIPLKRIGLPKDVANAFLFLASDMASYITGVILNVDGLAH